MSYSAQGPALNYLYGSQVFPFDHMVRVPPHQRYEKSRSAMIGSFCMPDGCSQKHAV